MIAPTASHTEGSLLAKMGIAATSFGGAIYGTHRAGQAESQEATAAREAALATTAVVPGAPDAKHADALQFLERCHLLGASGIQTQINGDIRRLRERAEELGMWMEGMVSICNSSPEQLERAILDAKSAGCLVVRDGMLSGRRYETFSSFADWNAWTSQIFDTIRQALPLFERHRLTLAIENHKDWTAEEFAALFATYSSEYLGACVDFGNNLSLLDDPMALIEAAAPYAKSTHVKDMAVRPCPDGFEMAEVPLGKGILDLPKMIGLLQKANPNIRLSLEMITRNALPVPCLTDSYWITFPARSGLSLARMLRYVETHKRQRELARFDHVAAAQRVQCEEDNIRECFTYQLETAGPSQ